MAKRSKRRLVREELTGVKLGDPRREARALAIADRLAQPEGDWQPFKRPAGWPEWLYRDPLRKSWF